MGEPFSIHGRKDDRIQIRSTEQKKKASVAFFSHVLKLFDEARYLR